MGELSKVETRQCVTEALEMLSRMAHRGACGCEVNTGALLGDLISALLRDLRTEGSGMFALVAASSRRCTLSWSYIHRSFSNLSSAICAKMHLMWLGHL